MDAEEQDFAERYGRMTEPELQTIAHDYDSLNDPAQAALRNEFARRGLEAPLIEEPEEQTSARKLVTLRRYRDLSEAIVARSLLESAGIVVYLYDENLIRLDWQVSNAIGGIRLQVEDSDAATAADLLDQPVPDSIDYEGSDASAEYATPHCPVCKSTDLKYQNSRADIAVGYAFMLGIPIPLGPKIWICNACGARWEDTDDATD